MRTGRRSRTPSKRRCGSTSWRSAIANRAGLRALAILEEAAGDGDVERLRVQSLGHLANLYRLQGHYPEAEPLFRQALAEKAPGSEPVPDQNPESSSGQALPQTRSGVRDPGQALGPEDLDLSAILNGLAVLYKSQGKYDEAEPLYRRSLSIFEEALGPAHPKVLTCRENYAQLLRKMEERSPASGRGEGSPS